MEMGDLVFGRQREGDVVRPFVGRIRSQTTTMFDRLTLYQVDTNIGRLAVPESSLASAENVVILRPRLPAMSGGDAA